MGCSANSKLIWGYKLTEKDCQRVFDEDLRDLIDGYDLGSVTIKSCGDARCGLSHEYIFGIIVGEGDYYRPYKVKSCTPTEEQQAQLEAVRKQYDFKVKEPALWLVTYIS